MTETEAAGPALPCTDEEAALARRLRFSIGRLSRQLRSENAALTPSQVSVLFSIRTLGPSRMVDLATHEAVAPPTLTPIVASLVSLGFLARKANPADARSALVELTDSGAGMLDQLLAERTRLVYRKVEGLPQATRASLEQVVVLLEELAEEQPGRAPQSGPDCANSRSAGGSRSDSSG